MVSHHHPALMWVLSRAQGTLAMVKKAETIFLLSIGVSIFLLATICFWRFELYIENHLTPIASSQDPPPPHFPMTSPRSLATQEPPLPPLLQQKQ